MDEEVIVLDLAGGSVHRLNPSATQIWLSCDGVTPVADIAARFAKEYGLSTDVALKDVLKGLAELERLGLITAP